MGPGLEVPATAQEEEGQAQEGVGEHPQRGRHGQPGPDRSHETQDRRYHSSPGRRQQPTEGLQHPLYMCQLADHRSIP